MRVPDSMAGSATDSSDCDMRVPLSDRHTVVACADKHSGEIDVGAPLDVDSIGVRAFSGGRDLDPGAAEVATLHECHVEELAVFRSHPSDH